MTKAVRLHETWNDENMIHFVTTKTHQEHNLFTNNTFCLTLWDEMFFYADLYNVDLLAFVIMPNHLHCLIWPQGEKTFSDYTQGVKGYSAKEIINQLPLDYERQQLLPPIADVSKKIIDPGHVHGLKDQIWQPSFFDYLIWSTHKLEEKLWYIKNNPVQAGLVKQPKNYDWLYVNPKIYEIV